jgi:hypothetical protein
MRERQGHQSRCHGLSTFLAELVVFDIGKVEISQYYLTRLRTEKSKYHTYNSWHAAPLVDMRERQGHQSRCHGLSTFLAELVVFDIGKVEISQYYLTRLRTDATAFGFPLLLAELVVSGIGKVEKLQYYLIL